MPGQGMSGQGMSGQGMSGQGMSGQGMPGQFNNGQQQFGNNQSSAFGQQQQQQQQFSPFQQNQGQAISQLGAPPAFSMGGNQLALFQPQQPQQLQQPPQQYGAQPFQQSYVQQAPPAAPPVVQQVVAAPSTLVSAETLEPLPANSMGLLIETRKNYNGLLDYGMFLVSKVYKSFEHLRDKGCHRGGDEENR